MAQLPRLRLLRVLDGLLLGPVLCQIDGGLGPFLRGVQAPTGQEGSQNLLKPLTHPSIELTKNLLAHIHTDPIISILVIKALPDN